MNQIGIKNYMTKNGVSYSVILITTISIIFLFQNVLELYIPFAGYIEDIIAVLFFIYFIIKVILTKKIIKTDMILLISLNIIIILGIYFNIKYKIQPYTSAIIIDVISNFKFIMIYLGLSYYLRIRKSFNFKQVNKIVAFIAKGYIIIIFIYAVLNFFMDIGMHQEYRYGLRTFSFIFGTPGQVINTTIYIILILYMDRSLSGKKTRNKLFICISLLVLLSTLKSRAIILSATFCILYETFEIENRKSIKSRIILVGIIGGMIGYSQFETYFLGGATPRQRLFRGGVELFKEYFPFGVGFGTYGSSTAAKYYSQLYYKYGFHNLYGMNPNDPAFLNDTFWPMIFGQLGLIGTILFIYLLSKFLIQIYKKARIQSNAIKLPVLFYIFNVVFSSIQSSYPGTNSMVFTTYLIIIVVMCKNRRKEAK